MDQPESRRPVHLNRVRGRPVIDANGDNVGTVEDVVAEPGTWRVSGFVVSLKREVADRLRVERGGFLDQPRLEVGADRVRTVGDNVLLNIDVGAIAETLRHRAPGASPPAPAEERFGAERFEPERSEPLYDPLDDRSAHQPPGGPPGF